MTRIPYVAIGLLALLSLCPSLAELRPRFDWTSLRVYDLNAPGKNHGILLGTRGWVP